MKKLIIALSVYIFVIALGFVGGYAYCQMLYLERAKEVLKQDKTTFEVQDIEIIIFGETQL